MFGPNSFLNRQPLRVLLVSLICNGMIANATPPDWWSLAHSSNPATPAVLNIPAVINGNSPNNQGPANIGQAKHMARSALLALRANGQSDIADLIEGELVGVNKPIASWTPPVSPAEQETQKSPLLIGQLKAIAHPFYNHLNGVAPAWVLGQIQLNHSGGAVPGLDYWQVTGNPKFTEGGYFPWNSATPVKANRAAATIGQLKAVFSLRFETLDIDADGIPDRWEMGQIEILVAGDPVRWAALSAAGTLVPNISYWDDGWTAGQSYSLGFTGDNRLLSDSLDFDGDHVPDANDADPFDKVVDWSPAAEASYGVIEIEQEDYSGYEGSIEPATGVRYPSSGYSISASIGATDLVLWSDITKNTDEDGIVTWSPRSRIWKNESWSDEIRTAPIDFQSTDLSTTYLSNEDTRIYSPTTVPATPTLSNGSESPASVYPQSACGDHVVGVGPYHGSRHDLPFVHVIGAAEDGSPILETRNDGVAEGGTISVATLWSSGSAPTEGAVQWKGKSLNPPTVTDPIPIDLPGSADYDQAYFGRSLGSPKGALAILGGEMSSSSRRWMVWTPPNGPTFPTYIPGDGAAEFEKSYVEGGRILQINAIEDGGSMAGETYQTDYDDRRLVVIDQGVKEDLPGESAKGWFPKADAICRIKMEDPVDSRLIAAGTDLWVKKNGVWKTAEHSPTVSPILAAAENGVLLGAGSIWRNGREVSLDKLVDHIKVSGLSSAVRYTNLRAYAMNTDGTIVVLADDADYVGAQKKTLLLLSPIEVTKLSPKLVTENDSEIPHSEKPARTPQATELVERDPLSGINDASQVRIAWRDMKVRIGTASKSKVVTWSMTPQFTPSVVTNAGPPEVLGADPGGPRFRGSWAHADPNAETSPHRDAFSPSEAYGTHGCVPLTPTSGGTPGTATTTVDSEGYTAIRVNVPPVAFNRARIRIQVEGMSLACDLIDLEVPAVVVIDPGHGGNTNITTDGKSDANHAVSYGVRPPLSTQPQQNGESEEAYLKRIGKTMEKNLTLNLGLALKTKIDEQAKQNNLRIRTVLTRDGDSNLSMGERTAISRRNGSDIFISMHFNGSDNTSTRGPEVYVEPPGPRPGDSHHNVNHDQDNRFGMRVQAALTNSIPGSPPFPGRGVKWWSDDYTHAIPTDNYADRSNRQDNEDKYPKNRACLAEMDWITNPDVENVLISGPQSAATRSNLVNALKDAIIVDLKTNE